VRGFTSPGFQYLNFLDLVLIHPVLTQVKTGDQGFSQGVTEIDTLKVSNKDTQVKPRNIFDTKPKSGYFMQVAGSNEGF